VHTTRLPKSCHSSLAASKSSYVRVCPWN